MRCDWCSFPQWSTIAIMRKPAILALSLLVWLFAVNLIVKSTVGPNQILISKDTSKENLIFTEHLVFEVEAVSVAHCVVLCWKTPGCQCSTATRESHLVTRRGHSHLITTGMTRIDAPRTSYLPLEELGNYPDTHRQTQDTGRQTG